MRTLRWGALFGGLAVVLVSPLSIVPATAGEPVPPRPPAATAAAQAPSETATGPTARYIIRYRSDATSSKRTAATAKVGARLDRRLTVFPGAVATLTPAQRDQLAADPSVVSVVADTPVHASGDAPVPWGIDRIDQATLPLDHDYTPSRTGSGVTVYVVDSGIAANPDFAGRVASGAGFVADGRGTADCNGHGTHVAGTVGGRTYGVAKGVTLVPVRILDCNGDGSSAGVVAGLDWIASVHKAGTPGVVNLSFSGPINGAQNDAVQRLVDAGLTVVSAAGNNKIDACDASPASAETALTVAATDSSDRHAGFSNFGSCVDLYAPGVDIPSVIGTSLTAQTMSGTSMSAPHVTGVAAMLLEAHRTWTPAKVGAQVLHLAVPDLVAGNPAGTPDFLLNIAPTVTSVSPAAGSVAGRERVTVTGHRLLGVTSVFFGGVAGTDVVVHSATSLSVTTPGHASGRVPVVVATELARSNATIGFTYRSRPVVSSVAPSAGPLGGGTAVVVRGSGFTDATAVLFGTAAASFTVVSDTELAAVAPPGESGRVHVRVVLSTGTSSKVDADRFTYGKLARVTKLSSAGGLTIGGERVTITGTSLSDAKAVLFGGEPATRLKEYSSTKLVVTAPAHAAGTVDVQVVNKYGTSAPASSARYTYAAAAAPAITRVSPGSGFSVGGATVTISGARFIGVQAVTFGGVAARVVSASSERLVVVAPAHAVGAVDVRVAGSYGTSPTTSAARYTYVETPAPTVTKVSPASGSRKGGTRVTIYGTGFVAVESVFFGDEEGRKVTVTSPTRLKVTTPAHRKGAVDVQVLLTPYLASAPSARARFSYT